MGSHGGRKDEMMTTVREILDRFLASKGTTLGEILVDEIGRCGVDATIEDAIDDAFYGLGTSVVKVVNQYLSDNGLPGVCDAGCNVFYGEDNNFCDDEFYLDLVTANKEPCANHDCEIPDCEGPGEGFHFWPAGRGELHHLYSDPPPTD
jgi:hypothetical protein